MQRVGLSLFVDFSDHRRRRLVDAALLFERLDLFRNVGSVCIDARNTKRPFHNNLPIAERLIIENL